MTESTHLTTSDLRYLRTMIKDLRLIQSTAFVVAGTNEDKRSIDYLKSLGRMEKLLEFELKDRLS